MSEVVDLLEITRLIILEDQNVGRALYHCYYFVRPAVVEEFSGAGRGERARITEAWKRCIDAIQARLCPADFVRN